MTIIKIRPVNYAGANHGGKPAHPEKPGFLVIVPARKINN